MNSLPVSQLVLLVSVAVFTLVAAVSDLRTRKIPNWMTVPMCVAGLIYQISFFQWSGLGNGLLGFLAGFGILFILWMIGSAGGGDVKLMGALGPWLGGWLTLKVLFVSLIFVTLGTFGIVFFGLVANGFRKTKEQYVKTGVARENVDQRQKRRVMAFAVPVALAAWCMLALQFFGDRG